MPSPMEVSDPGPSAKSPPGKCPSNGRTHGHITGEPTYSDRLGIHLLAELRREDFAARGPRAWGGRWPTVQAMYCVLCSAVQCSAAQCSAVQHSAAQCSTAPSTFLAVLAERCPRRTTRRRPTPARHLRALQHSVYVRVMG